jgi:DNA primase
LPGIVGITCSLGAHLNADQFLELCDGERTVYLTFDADASQSGQQAAVQLALRLSARGITARRVLLPQGHDPNSFFVEGGNTLEFQSLVEAAQP